MTPRPTRPRQLSRALAVAKLQKAAGRLAALCYPRRCPFCGAVLAGPGLICPDCQPKITRYEHRPPALPPTEHSFSGLSKAAGAYYYAGPVRHAVLRCKEHGNPWLADVLADLIAVRVFGATPPTAPGDCPAPLAEIALSYGDLLVPVPRALGRPDRGYSLPALLAARLGKTLGIPVATKLLVPARKTLPQKGLNQEQRKINQKNAYRVAPGGGAEGKRVVLVDDVITTGATVSACATALLQGGAASVVAVCIAADELPQKPAN